MNKSEILHDMAVAIAERCEEEVNIWSILPVSDKSKYLRAAEDAAYVLAISSRPKIGDKPDTPQLPTHNNVADVMRMVCDAAGVSVNSIARSRSRSTPITMIRRACIWACRNLVEATPTMMEVSRVVIPYTKDHTTAQYHLAEFHKHMDSVELVRKACEAAGPQWLDRFNMKINETHHIKRCTLSRPTDVIQQTKEQGCQPV